MFWTTYGDLEDLEVALPEMSDAMLAELWEDTTYEMNMISAERDSEAADYSPVGAANGLIAKEMRQRGIAP